MGLVTHTFQVQFSLLIFYSIRLLYFTLLYYALPYLELCTNLIHEFLRFTALQLFGITKVYNSHQLISNLASVIAIH